MGKHFKVWNMDEFADQLMISQFPSINKNDRMYYEIRNSLCAAYMAGERKAHSDRDRV